MAPEEAFADRIAVGPETAGHSGVDECNVRSSFIIGIREVSATQQWNAHSAEICGADGVAVRMRKFAGTGKGQTFDGNVSAAVVARQGKRCSHGDGLDAGNHANAVEKLLPK